jgi:hypothetical protein
MLEFIKKMQQRQFEKQTDEDTKPKKDKVFIAILIIFAVIGIFSFFTGFGQVKEKFADGGISQVMNYDFNFSVFDGIVFGGTVGGYVFMKIRKGRKK